MTQEYNTAVKEFKDLSEYNSKYLSFLNSLDSIKKYGFSGDFSNTEQQIRTQIDMNINLMQQKKQIIDKYEEEIRSFSICLLVTPDRQAWLNHCINPDKDYYNYYQSVCGMKENNETFEECAIRETKEEANIEIEELNFINVHNGFHKFSDGKEYLFKTLIYYSFIDKIPVRMELSKHDEWFLCELKDLKKYKLTDSLKINLEQIIDIISKKCTSLKRKKKRKIEENDDEDNHSVVSTLSEKEDIKTEDETKWKITNQKIRY